jgi:hypothetical protein
MLHGTIIFIALILVVACSLLYWLSALCGDYPHPKRDGKALKKHHPTAHPRGAPCFAPSTARVRVPSCMTTLYPARGL